MTHHAASVLLPVCLALVLHGHYTGYPAYQGVLAIPTNVEPPSEIVYPKCTGPGDPGQCKDFGYRYRFEQTINNCAQFIWGGCGGNLQNNFETYDQCMQQCANETHATQPPTPLTTTMDSSSTVRTQTQEVWSLHSSSSTLAPVPDEMRGSELTFKETGYEKTFMFAKNNTFIQMDGDTIQTFQLRLCREISFQFRTRLPHGLLVYHNVKTPSGVKLDPYALYVIVEKGQLKVVHVFGNHSTSVTVGEGLNRDEWHSVMVRIDVHGARLIARVDNNKEEVYLKGLNHETNYGVSNNLMSVVLVGGLSSEEKLHGVKYIIESFVGCIRNVVLSSGKAASDLLPITPLIATKHENVKEGCRNKCHSRQNLCFKGSRCINHYYDISCDCFGTRYEGEYCDIYTATVLTLRGSSYVSYRIYDWKDRVHSPLTRISMMFKTNYDDSALFYASGESLKPQYIAASIKNHSAYIEMDFGDGVMSATLGQDLTRHYWHNLTILHEHDKVIVILDDHMKVLDALGANHNLLFDPEIYFGGGQNLGKRKGLASSNNFVGSLKYVFYNDVSVLFELRKGNPKVHYIGVLEEEYYEANVEVIPITFSYAKSHIWWPMNNPDTLALKFDFKSSKASAVLAYSEVQTSEGQGFWEIRLAVDRLSFDLCPDVKSNVTHTTYIRIENPTSWHSIHLSYERNEIKFVVDYRHAVTQMYGLSFNIGDKLIIGSSLKAAASGLVGCLRDLKINGIEIEPRYLVKSERVVGDVSLDNCKYVDPCKKPNTCEHGGKCSVKDDGITCDCKDTGYIGKNCHFTKFRKTCEELALLGYSKSDVYSIDIDGNGVFPPARVKCDFQSLANATKTIVEHNLPSQVDVRSATDEDFSFHIQYREFSAEMLQELISHSLYCTQYIKYDCIKAPLELHSSTWFKSSSNNNTVDSLGEVKRGTCPCAVGKNCEDPSLTCNCDANLNRWLSDEGYFKEPPNLGITQMYFLRQKNLDEESQGRITLGPLECVETNTQKYVVTFTTSQSYIEVPGWRKGDIAFSFRTTGEKAILLFQPPIRSNYPSFMVALTGDYQLTFNFTLNTGTPKTLVIDTNRKLNGGEWHKIWIDYNEHHVRFMINTDTRMVDLQPEEEFGPFEGSMFIGGAPTEISKKYTVKQGLIGCFRGLVVNGEILDIYSFMSVHLSEIIKDCKPSCVPNPCKNGAYCRELWSTFECVCKNRWAHLGQHCETNVNEDALTFISRESYLKRNYLSDAEDLREERERLQSILNSSLLINLRTYDRHAFVLYANDQYNNFIHLFLTNQSEVVYLYNYGNDIVNLTIEHSELNNGRSMQVAVIRTETNTTLFVNERNVTVDRGFKLLEDYSNKPWSNPEHEVLSPHRPPAPPTKYFQFNIGGYDPANLLRPNQDTVELEGYIGCIRGLKIGENLISLREMATQNNAHVTDGVLNGCQMKCDAEPCKNGGICTENFVRQESSCNCEHTSFLGEFCSEEKGASFSGEATLLRKLALAEGVTSVRLQLAFSSHDLRRANRVMLLLQSRNDRSYYLMVAITAENHLYIEEDREGSTYAARIEGNFMDDARHSVYYTRHGDVASLLVDRISIPIKMVPNKPLVPVSDPGANHVQIGGVNTTDPRFAVYKSYDGCLSNIFIAVNNETMKPLEEYMLFTKSEAETITVINSQGVRSAQCKQFDVIQKLTPFNEPALNMTSQVLDKNWVVDAPTRVPYKAVHFDPSQKEEKTQVVFIALTAVFVIIVVCCLIEVYRSDREYRKRQERQTDEDIIWSKEQAAKMQLESSTTSIKGFGYKSVPGDDKKDNGKPLVGILKNGNATAPAEKIVEKPIVEAVTGGIRDSQLIDHELQWESLVAEENESLLTKSPSGDTIASNGPTANGNHSNRLANGGSHVANGDDAIEEDHVDGLDSELTDNPDGVVIVQPVQPIHADHSVSFASAPPCTEDVVLANASASSITTSDSHLHSSSDNNGGTIDSNESNKSDQPLPTGPHTCQLDLPDAVTSPAADVKIPIVPVQRRHRRLPLINLGPDRRQYANPIAYLGGPRIDRRPNVDHRSSIASSQGDSITSINSIMSLD
ncbi:axotactin isoform X1 [Anopheles aquasalis]|uniref:axotactin isoform X1 n=1 Tax=Anopheles aquasalis TaxID=42839 RepID=UPI00215ABE75|nr:axotactin isoform X1 [Anopheles aquasalis]XP_050095321.1 axotactin isoform X1 [Anopheles aquasalis]XP_050095322.1 axotactin isoform X1 [Anopheles aquasalis]XP_050095323.1 axotactin isoform X1 [Anopheles aquasalis]